MEEKVLEIQCVCCGPRFFAVRSRRNNEERLAHPELRLGLDSMVFRTSPVGWGALNGIGLTNLRVWQRKVGCMGEVSQRHRTA
jgi:hypothetical protein